MHLKRLKADIMLLQETHWRSDHYVPTRAAWLDPPILSTYKSKSHGVAIYLQKGLACSIDNHYTDSEGHFVYLKLALPHKTLTLLNVYLPNQPNADFYSSIMSFLLQRDSPNLIVMGDFNAVVSPQLDCSNYRDDCTSLTQSPSLTPGQFCYRSHRRTSSII